MTNKDKRQAEEKKLIERAKSMYRFTHGKEPSENWCKCADRAKFLFSYYKEQYNIIG